MKVSLTISIDHDADADDFKTAHDILYRLQGFNEPAKSSPLDAPQPLPVDPPADIDPATVGFGAGVVGASISPAPAAIEAGSSPLDRIEKDADGLPHDNRIHASTRTKNQDGRWKKKKGVDAARIAHVEAELRNILGLPAPTTVHAASAIPSHELTVQATASGHSQGAHALEVSNIPPAPAVPAPPITPSAVPAAPASDAPKSFSELMAILGPMLAAGKLSATAIGEELVVQGVVDAAGVGQLTLLATRPDLIPAVYTGLKARIVG